MAKEQKVLKKQNEQTPRSGGSFIRNKDGSLVKNNADSKEPKSAIEFAEKTTKE